MTAPASLDFSTDVRTHERDFCLARVRDMLRIRRLEERCAQLYGEQKIRGFLHLYIGEEAVAAGVMPSLQPQDNVVATYREHGHALLRGVGMNAIMAEMYGKQEGCSRGHGGSMHLFDRATRFYGGNAIVGGGLTLAVGLALADVQLQREGCVTACFFGEGAVAEGAFHESLNLAALWRLPVLFICENNLYAMGTALSRSQASLSLTAKAAAYGMATAHVNGMNVLAVHETARAAVAQVREQRAPLFLELHTYRFRAHSMFDVELYRDKGEVEGWKQHGPIHTFTDRLKAAGMMDEADFARIDREAMQEVEAAVQFAEAGTWENAERLLDDVVAR
jgi:pyruvate dehydrogenase E1 component alpha subunit